MKKVYYAEHLPKQGGIYRIRNTENAMEYIGESKNIYVRVLRHIHLLRSNSHHCQYLQNAWNKYGNNSFVFEVVELIPDAGRREKQERYYIRKSKRCYNVTGNANKEYPLSPTDEDAYHDKFTEYIEPGKKYKRPGWHVWVYGGGNNPILHRRSRNTPEETKP